MATLLRTLRTTIAGGLLFLVPVVLFIVILEKALRYAERLVAPVARQFPDTPVLGLTAGTLVAALALIVVSFVAGLFARTRAGQRTLGWIEHVVLAHLPGYTIVKAAVGDLSRSLGHLAEDSGAHAVLVTFDDAWRLGFVVDDTQPGRVAVFLPGAPTALSGELVYVTRDRVRDSGLDAREATLVLRRLGVDSARRLGSRLAD